MKKKALPMWIREGLEKLEKQKQKQKKQDQPDEEEPKKSSLNLSGSASSIAGYDHGKVDSPVHSPKSNDSDEVNDNKALWLSLIKMGNYLNTMDVQCSCMYRRLHLSMYT